MASYSTTLLIYHLDSHFLDLLKNDMASFAVSIFTKTNVKEKKYLVTNEI